MTKTGRVWYDDEHGISIALYVTKYNGPVLAAARDMLEALEAVEDELGDCGIHLVRAAIAKAKGTVTCFFWCGGQVVKRQCKEVCLRCGMTRD